MARDEAEIDFAVAGGGLVGMAVAYGLARLGRKVTVFDEGDLAYRASRGNFGLVWVQGKGVDMPNYARWTRLSASLWPELAEDLSRASGVGLELRQPGGFDICLSEEELQGRTARFEGLRDALGGDYPFETLGHNALRRMLPAIGPKVAGATFFPEDGHVNPLYLLRGLVQAFQALGGRIVNGTGIERILPEAEAFRLESGGRVFEAGRVVLAAGLGNAKLAPMVGLNAPVKPNRGQVLITERVQPFLDHPTAQIRQVGEGAVQIGDSKEDVGLDDTTSPEVVGAIAKRATRIFPILEQARVVRSWVALRVRSPDSHPIYDRSTAHPGAYLVTCHSGVTLAASHALRLAPWIATGETDLPYMEAFSAKRFDLRSVA
jgi:glycine/D-amino acid oxidase-like deaminating enzyme